MDKAHVELEFAQVIKEYDDYFKKISVLNHSKDLETVLNGVNIVKDIKFPSLFLLTNESRVYIITVNTNGWGYVKLGEGDENCDTENDKIDFNGSAYPTFEGLASDISNSFTKKWGNILIDKLSNLPNDERFQ
ncbi:hypothetical protein B5S28_g1297 [[Candida] boidinii]|uniref:Unnamed protein product n=1 Tax=Candida boidinii TaxID=5477 RepID=A0ACB5TGL3_CANBO|nr:hypothetical protein B5S28_g1297 [[Candida] boidinii]OWB60756.1 hypothetical protein B5S29_g1637 [[Candida] boidinii]OWB70856.1 hypothetical protein B5S31_g537 [[Candida] boidinii]OWB76745.1 hypothetical protein B5S32_g900 [[Candida] boidinii]GME73247.1 unnamed protein product [[Candida] boidinii]